MRRLDVVIVGLVGLVGGALLFAGLPGESGQFGSAQIWASSAVTLGLMIWVLTYLRRVVSGGMALKDQRDAYQLDQMKQKLATMTPDELAALAAEIEAESALETPSSEETAIL